MSDTPAGIAEGIAARMAAALDFARQAGDITLGYFGGSGFAVERKQDGSEVTTADREAELCLRGLIGGAFPEDGILGEEFDEKPSASGWRWVLDPIDGTASFVRGVPLYGTLVACEYAQKTHVGVIQMPALGETVYASEGGGAWHSRSPGDEPREARVSRVEEVSSAMMCTTSFDYFEQVQAESAMTVLLDRFGSTRGWSDCYAHVLCATGRVDAVVEPVLHPWDIAPMQVIYPEAGGCMSDWRGREGAYHPTGVASNSLLHRELLALLAPIAAHMA